MALQTEVKPAYPVKYEAEVLLHDGSRIFLRPIKLEDTQRWLAFVNRLSDRTKYFRFHTVPKQFTMEDALRYCTVDYVNAFAFVAEVLRQGSKEIVAIGRYYRLPDKKSAEVAFVTEDVYQKRGLGTKLMEWLVNVALDNGISDFEAEVLSDNEDMMNVFRDYGFHITSELTADVYHVTFPITRTRRVIKKEEERERIATVNSLRSLLYPKSIAVIGASRHPGSLGHAVFQRIIENGYTGVLYPVNPNADAILAVKAYPSILDVPGDVEMAIILIPAPLVASVVDDCGRKGVKSLIVISDGFKERGHEGALREAELREIALGHGMRVLGPNCMGVINTDPSISMNATFSPIYPSRGSISFLSQSGAMGLAVLGYVKNLNMGMATMITVGNTADISPNDLLQYWEGDPATRVILLYLESYEKPQKFSRLARRITPKKPIVAIKSGSTSFGSRAASSHTGAMATPDTVSDALFHQAGMLRASTVQELFDVATLLDSQPLPKSRRLAIVTNGGGPGVIAADACAKNGLSLPEFSADTLEKLKTTVRQGISINNPLDLTAGASPEEFESVMKILASDAAVDAVIVIFAPLISGHPTEMYAAICRAAPTIRRRNKPLLACFMGQEQTEFQLQSEGSSVPIYLFPEVAVSALDKAATYYELSRKPQGTIPKFRNIQHGQARRLIESLLKRTTERPVWLSAEERVELLNYYGIRIAETLVAKTPVEAATLAAKLSFPVVIKVDSPTIQHKTDVGGVILGVDSERAAKAAFNEIKARLTKISRANEMTGVTVQHQISGGVETIVGVTQDPSFGPLILFGLGGVFTELIQDVNLRLHPLTDLDATEVIHSLKTSRIFEGFRGAPPSDTSALKDLLLRVSAMVEDIPQIAEMDLNPVIVMPQGQGYWVVDARIAVK